MRMRLQLLLAAVPAAALVVFAASWIAWPLDSFAGPLPPGFAVCFWVVVAVVASGSPIQVPRGSLVSVSAAPVVATAILGGPTAAAIVAAIGTLELRELRGRVPWYGSVYNHTFVVIPAVMAGMAYSLVVSWSGVDSPDAVMTVGGLVGGVSAGVVYVLTSTALSSLAVALREGRAYSAVLQSDIRSVGLTMVGLTPIAWLMAVAYDSNRAAGRVRLCAAVVHNACCVQGRCGHPQHVHADRSRAGLGHRCS